MDGQQWVFLLIVVLALATMGNGNFLAGQFSAPFQSAQPWEPQPTNWIGWVSLMIVLAVAVWLALRKL